MEPEPQADNAATSGEPHVVGPADGKTVDLGSLGVRFMVWIFKPRHQWHTFWNAGDGPCHILEIISPGGFERLFEEAAEPREAAPGETPLDARYGIEFDFESVGRLCEEHSFAFPGE